MNALPQLFGSLFWHFFLILFYLTLQYCIGFAIYQNESATGIHCPPFWVLSSNCSVAQSYPTLCDPMDCSTPGFPVIQHLPELAQTHVHWVIKSNILSSNIPFSSYFQSFPASGYFPLSWLFTSGGQSIGASPSSSVPQMNILDWFLLEFWLVFYPCSLKDTTQSSPTPQFKSISSSALSLLYGPTVTSIHDYWKNHSSDYTDLGQQSHVSVF